MTERPPARALPRRPGPWPVIAGSLALFLVTLAFLALQLRAGRDPALGAGPVPAKRVLVQREERKVVITRVVPQDDNAEGDDAASGDDDTGSAPSAASTVAAVPAAPPPPSPPVSSGSS